MDWYKTSVPDGELQHAGIKGMKWGVRRFQNEDGTWTEAGKKRYGKSSSKVGSHEKSDIDRLSSDEKYELRKKVNKLRDLVGRVESRWETGELFDNEHSGRDLPVYFNKDNPGSEIENNILRIKDGDWDGYQDSDMREAIKLLREIEASGISIEEALKDMPTPRKVNPIEGKKDLKQSDGHLWYAYK